MIFSIFHAYYYFLRSVLSLTGSNGAFITVGNCKVLLTYHWSAWSWSRSYFLLSTYSDLIHWHQNWHLAKVRVGGVFSFTTLLKGHFTYYESHFSPATSRTWDQIIPLKHCRKSLALLGPKVCWPYNILFFKAVADKDRCKQAHLWRISQGSMACAP